MRPFAVTLALSLLVACSPAKKAEPAAENTAASQPSSALTATEGWVRLPAVTGNPGAAYFTLTGGASEDLLVAASSPAFQRVELHQSMERDGKMSMDPMASVPVPAGNAVRFEPGGKHLMLFGADQALKPGGEVQIDLDFEKAGRVSLIAAVRGPADEAPDSHDGH